MKRPPPFFPAYTEDDRAKQPKHEQMLRGAIDDIVRVAKKYPAVTLAISATLGYFTARAISRS